MRRSRSRQWRPARKVPVNRAKARRKKPAAKLVFFTEEGVGDDGYPGAGASDSRPAVTAAGGAAGVCRRRRTKSAAHGGRGPGHGRARARLAGGARRGDARRGTPSGCSAPSREAGRSRAGRGNEARVPVRAVARREAGGPARGSYAPTLRAAAPKRSGGQRPAPGTPTGGSFESRAGCCSTGG